MEFEKLKKVERWKDIELGERSFFKNRHPERAREALVLERV